MAKSVIDAVVAGYLCLDISPDLSSLAQPVRLTEVFAPTLLTEIGPPTISTGGAVSNTGLAMRRLGIKVALMGKCGRDSFGQAVLDFLDREAPGSAATTTLVENEPTSYTIVLSPPGIDRFFLHCPGTNDTFGFADLNLDIISRARLFHLGYPPLMKRMLANKGRELIKAYKAVHQLGVTTSLDMAMPDVKSPAGRMNWPSLLQRLLPHVDLFLPSVEELIFIMAPARFKAILRKAKGPDLLAGLDLNLVRQLAEKCLAMGAKVVVVKCGRLGIYCRTASAESLIEMGKACPKNKIRDWADREIFEPIYKVNKITSALGAGDCAVAGFLAALLGGTSLPDALRYSAAAGAQNVKVLDAVSGTKSWRQTTTQIRSNPPKAAVPIDMTAFKAVRSARHYLGPHDSLRA